MIPPLMVHKKMPQTPSSEELLLVLEKAYFINSLQSYPMNLGAGPNGDAK